MALKVRPGEMVAGRNLVATKIPSLGALAGKPRSAPGLKTAGPTKKGHGSSVRRATMTSILKRDIASRSPLGSLSKGIGHRSGSLYANSADSAGERRGPRTERLTPPVNAIGQTAPCESGSLAA